MTPGEPLWQTLLPIAIIGIVLAARLRSVGKRRPLKHGRLWVQPIILLGVAGLVIGRDPPDLVGISLCVAAAILGAAIGWHRGKLMRIEYDAHTGGLTQATSPAAIILLLGIVAVRFAARAYFARLSVTGRLDAHAFLLTDVLLCFAIAMLAATRVEMGLRARAILAGPQSSQ